VLDIPPGDWWIAVYSDDGRILTLTGVSFLFRNGSAGAPYDCVDTIAHPGVTTSPITYGTFTVPPTAGAALRTELSVLIQLVRQLSICARDCNCRRPQERVCRERFSAAARQRARLARAPERLDPATR
jgi:hypothetical protein